MPRSSTVKVWNWVSEMKVKLAVSPRLKLKSAGLKEKGPGPPPSARSTAKARGGGGGGGGGGCGGGGGGGGVATGGAGGTVRGAGASSPPQAKATRGTSPTTIARVVIRLSTHPPLNHASHMALTIAHCLFPTTLSCIRCGVNSTSGLKRTPELQNRISLRRSHRGAQYDRSERKSFRRPSASSFPPVIDWTRSNPRRWADGLCDTGHGGWHPLLDRCHPVHHSGLII